jgi:phosphatidylglycerol:prolipoprotein diacylglycerol transferase
VIAALNFPSIDPVALRLGSLSVRWYGLAYLGGFLAAWWILTVLDERWKMGLGPDGRVTTVFAAVVGVIAGGRLGYVLFYGAGAYWTSPIRILQIWDGGMSFHGGLIGILLAGVWVAHHYKVPFLRLCDVGAVGAPVGIFLGRIANFVNGELWGRATSVWWGVVFPNAPLVNGVNLPRHPSQIYEALLEGLVIFLVMLVLVRRRRPDGFLVGWMLTLYGVFRIFVEFFREPDIQIGFLPGGITLGQVLSVPLVLIGIWLIWRTRGKAAPADDGHERPEDPPLAGAPVGAPGSGGAASSDEALVADRKGSDRS